MVGMYLLSTLLMSFSTSFEKLQRGGEGLPRCLLRVFCEYIVTHHHS